MAFSCRTQTSGNIYVGVHRTKKLKWLVHWSQDFMWISCLPRTSGLNATLFLAKLTTAGERVEARRCLKEQSDIKAKESTLGPLVSESKW